MAPSDLRYAATGSLRYLLISVWRGIPAAPRTFYAMAILVPVALLMIVAVWLWINVRSESRQRVERMSGV
ncbi:MAG TPA: hypothetical protein VFV47_08875, partial [Hyphomicrobiaceae bacterium]|nr:hypothetical protein [Hyphomicrobiaceae bacterium]